MFQTVMRRCGESRPTGTRRLVDPLLTPRSRWNRIHPGFIRRCAAGVRGVTPECHHTASHESPSPGDCRGRRRIFKRERPDIKTGDVTVTQQHRAFQSGAIDEDSTLRLAVLKHKAGGCQSNRRVASINRTLRNNQPADFFTNIVVVNIPESSDHDSRCLQPKDGLSQGVAKIA